MRRRPLRAVARWTGVLLLTAVVTVPAKAQEDSPVRKRTVYEDLQMFSQVLNQIRVNHPDTVDPHAMFMAAIEGMVRAADPHSYVIPATRLTREKERAFRDGELVPVPVRFRFIGGAPVVAAVGPGVGAVSGIIPGDELVAVDGEPVTAATAAELEIVLAGPEGSEVELTFRRRTRDGDFIPVARRVTRERVSAKGVHAGLMLDDSVGYVRVTTFADDEVAAALDRALDDLEDRGMTGLVLDLRDNGGGLVEEAAAVAGAFLPKGALVYTTSGRKEEVVDTGRVRRSFFRSRRTYPVVALVNEGTASAAELVAGALQDHDRALVAGRPTFGKALVMQPFPLTDGSLMMLVVGKAHTPCGRTIQRAYRRVSTREYYRSAADERERLERDPCTTTGGRTVYGGDGIYPDRILDAETTPRWLDRVHEADLLLRWVPGFLQEDSTRYARLEPILQEPRLRTEEIQAFLDFAADQGVTLPDDEIDLEHLHHVILTRVVRARFGDDGLYTFLAHTEPEVRQAARLLPEARALEELR